MKTGTVKAGTVIRPVLAVVTGVLVLLPVVACTATPAAPRSAVSASRTAPRQAGLAGTRRHADVVAGTVTLAFAGDVNFAGRTARLLSDPASAFGPITTVLKSVDFAAVNLETSITGRGTPQPKTYHFRARPGCLHRAARRRCRPGHDGQQPRP